MKHYTYEVICTFTMQYTFVEDEVVPADDGDKGDVEPSKSALTALKEEMLEHLGAVYFIEDLSVEAEFDSLLGVEDL